jgi:26S proteasome regulatory subunit T3
MMVCDIFHLAKENAHAIILIYEIDAIATICFDAPTRDDREIQRILIKLLNYMGGLEQTISVKVIMESNRTDTLDIVLLRPRIINRKIEFPLPNGR